MSDHAQPGIWRSDYSYLPGELLESLIMKLTAQNDDGVSPVIGTILLVAITVVLVAIVAAVVMGMVGQVSSTKDVGVTVQPWSDDTYHGVTVLLYGGNDVSNLNTLNVSVDGAELDIPANQPNTADPQVGKVYKFNVTATDKNLVNKLVVVTGNFTDGTTSVLAQTTLTIPKATKVTESS
jgi:flagellin-like protein